MEKANEMKINIEKYQEQLKLEMENRLKHEERVLQLHKELKGVKVKYPSEWEPQTTNCELKELLKESDEFRRIADRVKESIKCEVLSIARYYMWEFILYFIEYKTNGYGKITSMNNANYKRKMETRIWRWSCSMDAEKNNQVLSTTVKKDLICDILKEKQDGAKEFIFLRQVTSLCML